MRIYIGLLIVFYFSACTNPKEMKLPIDLSSEQLTLLNDKKIYFGHQSVGFNIMDGVEEILTQYPESNLHIVRGKDISLFKNAVLAHEQNGKNRDPKSKIDDFYQTMQKIGPYVDIAGFKFCYVDFEEGTDTQSIFDYYQDKMNQLKEEFPHIRFIHFTVPLRSIQSGPKAIIKKILGKDIGLKDNLVRNTYNDLIRKTYSENTIFDIAKIESTDENGNRIFKERNGRKIFIMHPPYTFDSGHLSKKGRMVVGSAFLKFIAQLDSVKN